MRLCDFKVLAYQLAGVFVLIAWGAGFCLVMFGVLKWAGILRVDSRMEVYGMDSMKHDEPAYPAESWEEQQYWDHQVHRLVHLLSSAALAGQKTQLPESVTAANVMEVEKIESKLPACGLPPQMNFAHLVLTDHFQKCVLSLDQRMSSNRTKWHLQV